MYLPEGCRRMGGTASLTTDELTSFQDTID
jgi:hypothetical protein